MNITATELKHNLGKYLELASNEDIFILKRGQKIAKLTKPTINKQEVLDSLVGILPNEEIDLDKIKEERLKRQ